MMRVRRYGFHTEDGGAGRFRGGKGVVLDYEIASERAWLTAIFGRGRFPCWGLEGGQHGSPNRIEIHRRDGRVEHHGSVARLPLARGDVVRLITGTGGGFGDPRDRPRARVAEDLRNGYITGRQAREHYGWGVS